MTSTPVNDFLGDERPPRVLVIDDNPSIHRDFDLVFLDESENAQLDADDRRIYGEGTTEAAPRSEYELWHAGSGQEGIELVTKEKAAGRFFQLAFVDIRMPGMDGVETIERLWKIDPRMQMVICTAYADYSQEDLARRLGETDKLLLLKKPFDSIEVTQLARTLTEKWYLARQATLKLEQMELLVSQRTQKLVELQPTAIPPAEAETEGEPEERAPVILVVAESDESGGSIALAVGKDRQVVIAREPGSGLEKARELVPDLIIIETARPQSDGLALCRRLKSDVLTSHAPVMVVASGEGADCHAEALSAGADDYFDQAPKMAGLEGRVAKLLEVRRASFRRQTAGEAWRARELALNPADARFLRRVVGIVEQNLSDFEFDVDVLARSAAVSRRQLFRKLKALVDTTPKAMIRSIRLRRASQLLAESKMSVTEITFAVGFLDVKHFRAVFRQEFGVAPSEFRQSGPGPDGAGKRG